MILYREFDSTDLQKCMTGFKSYIGMFKLTSELKIVLILHFLSFQSKNNDVLWDTVIIISHIILSFHLVCKSVSEVHTVSGSVDQAQRPLLLV